MTEPKSSWSKWKPPKTRYRRWEKFKVVKIETVEEALARGIEIEVLPPRELPEIRLNEVRSDEKYYGIHRNIN